MPDIINRYIHKLQCAYRVFRAPPITRDEFAVKMQNAAQMGDIEGGHILADEIVCQLLKQLGYHEGAVIFDEMEKWHA